MSVNTDFLKSLWDEKLDGGKVKNGVLTASYTAN